MSFDWDDLREYLKVLWGLGATLLVGWVGLYFLQQQFGAFRTPGIVVLYLVTSLSVVAWLIFSAPQVKEIFAYGWRGAILDEGLMRFVTVNAIALAAAGVVAVAGFTAASGFPDNARIVFSRPTPAPPSIPEAGPEKEGLPELADLTEAIRLDPQNGWLYYDRGQVYYDRGELDKAVADYTESIRLLSGKSKGRDLPCAGRAIVHLDRAEYALAIEDLSEAIRLATPSLLPRHLRFRGNAYRMSGNVEAAVADLTEAIRLDPKSALSYSERALAYIAREDYSNAVADATEAIRLKPGAGEVYKIRGRVRLEMGLHDQAIADFCDAISRGERISQVYHDRGVAHAEKGSYDAAITDYTEALRLAPRNAVTLADRGLAYLDKKDADRAIADFTEALKLDPKRGATFTGRGRAHALKRDFSAALADLKRGVEVRPDLAGCHAELAWFLSTCPDAKFRDGKQALGHATRACELLEWKAPWLLVNLAAAHAEIGDFAQAVEYQKKAFGPPNQFSPKQLERELVRLKLYESGKPYRSE